MDWRRVMLRGKNAILETLLVEVSLRSPHTRQSVKNVKLERQ